MNDLEQDIWAEHLEEIARREEEMILQPGEKTLSMFMEEAGLTKDKARSYLDKMVSNGRMRKRKLPDGRVAFLPLT